MENDICLESLCKIQYGMYIVTSKDANKKNGQIATVVSQVTAEPIQLMTCISKETLTHEMIEATGLIGVSILEEATPMKFIGHFGFRSGREFDKFVDMPFKEGKLGVPLVLKHTLVVLEGQVNRCLDVGTHTIFVFEVLSSDRVKKGEAMTYEYYHTVVKGKSPKNAPTYHCSVSKCD